jgi:xanthine dehydrogenase YagS FAD-binding subunit
MALVAYEAQVELSEPTATPDDQPGPTRVPIQAVLGMDSLPAHALLTGVRLGAPVMSERSAYVRASNRAYAEWALAEVSVRIVLGDDGMIEFIRVAAGGVAPTPLRLHEVEDALLAVAPKPAVLTKAAALASAGATPLPMTGYKLELLEGAVLEALERALRRSPTPASIDHEDGA